MERTEYTAAERDIITAMIADMDSWEIMRAVRAGEITPRDAFAALQAASGWTRTDTAAAARRPEATVKAWLSPSRADTSPALADVERLAAAITEAALRACRTWGYEPVRTRKAA